MFYYLHTNGTFMVSTIEFELTTPGNTIVDQPDYTLSDKAAHDAWLLTLEPTQADLDAAEEGVKALNKFERLVFVITEVFSSELTLDDNNYLNLWAAARGLMDNVPNTSLQIIVPADVDDRLQVFEPSGNGTIYNLLLTLTAWEWGVDGETLTVGELLP